MRAPTIEQVKEAYRRHYNSTKDTTEAWNRTLNELAGPFDPNASEEWQDIRKKIGDFLRDISRDLNYELGDPYEVAVHTAIEQLKQSRVAEIASDEYKKAVKDIKAGINTGKRKGPKEWRPRVREEELEEAAEKEFEEEMEGRDFPTLFIMFDDKGGLEGWQIEWPDYWHGHGGPTAQVFLSEDLDYSDVRRAISEAFESIDWDEIQGEMEKEEGENA